MADNGPYVIISYIPLLRGQAGDLIDISAKGQTEGIKNRIAKAMESQAGFIDGVAWSLVEGKVPAPTLIMYQMNEVLDHLIEWAEELPQMWFNFHIYEHGDKYTVALMPNFEQSIARFAVALKMFHDIDMDPKAPVHMLFKPLTFVSGPNPKIFNMIKKDLPPKLMVRCIDVKDVPAEKPPGFTMDEKKIRELGQFKVRHDSFHGWLDKLIDDAKPNLAITIPAKE